MKQYLVMSLMGLFTMMGVPPVATAQPLYYAQSDETPRYVPRDTGELKRSFSPVVEAAAPAVVNVYTKRVVKTAGRRSVFEDDPFFRQFFGRGFGSMPRERVQNSLGSGVIVRPDGIIVTNNHVIEGMTEIKIVLNDRREYEAELLLADARTDLAILKVAVKEDLPFIQFSDSDTVAVGDIVLAIGNPFGVGQTVTSGIVSALARTQVSISDFQFFIQTDAAINPGNSGGALVDVDGKLLGVNSAIYSRSGGSNGIGFAIPGNLVQQVLRSALKGGNSVQRPWLGASAETVTSELAKALGLDRPAGAIIGEIYPQSPAAKAGLQEGDVITRIGTYDVYDAEAMRYRVGTRREGEVVTIEYKRDGIKKAGQLKLALPPETPRRDLQMLEGQHPLSGIKIANLSPSLNEEVGRSPFDRGVVVLEVDKQSYARRYGVREKYRIVSINGQDINNVRDVVIATANPNRRWVIQMENTRGQISTMRIGR